jgi:hypothetical protein
MQEQHHHHHHRKDSATRFKERSLNAIVIRRKLEKWLKIALIVLASFMVILTVCAFLFG